MELIVAAVGLICMLVAVCAGFFLCFVQPIWSIVDVATARHLSSGAKAALIVLTLVLLGPVLTFIYAFAGSRSRALRTSTLVGAVAFAVAVVSLAGAAALAPDRGDTPSVSVVETPTAEAQHAAAAD